MNQSTALMGLYARTPLHAGAGAGVSDGIIDLPIQREGHSGWPCVYGSGVKGALRHHAHAANTTGKWQGDIDALFGPEHAAAEKQAYAGALTTGDARLLLLPIRSLTTCFRQVTCPALLQRLTADARRLGLQIGDLPDVAPSSEEALVIEPVNGGLYLEEYRFTANTDDADKLQTIATTLAGLAPEVTDLATRLTVIHNDDFSYLAKHATPVAAHIAIDSQSKTTKGGALWYEETLPPETLLVCAISATRARGEKANAAPAEMLTDLQALFADRAFLQIGGNETVGMGWCEVSFNSKPAAAQG